MSPDQGGHTSMPVFGMKPPSYRKLQRVRDARHRAARVRSDGRRRERPLQRGAALELHRRRDRRELDDVAARARASSTIPYQGPMVLSTMSVDPRSGEKYPRGNYCGRGARFGVHSQRGELQQSAVRQADGASRISTAACGSGTSASRRRRAKWRSTCRKRTPIPTPTAT